MLFFELIIVFYNFKPLLPVFLQTIKCLFRVFTNRMVRRQSIQFKFVETDRSDAKDVDKKKTVNQICSQPVFEFHNRPCNSKWLVYANAAVMQNDVWPFERHNVIPQLIQHTKLLHKLILYRSLFFADDVIITRYDTYRIRTS